MAWQSMKSDQKSRILAGFVIVGWVTMACLGIIYHEVWRDEAQAWLVAKSSGNFFDLLMRSSGEASGFVYYFILWPFAKLWPESFPFYLVWISRIGTLLALVTFWKIPRGNFVVKALVTLGYLFGYEYIVIGRLYGWGSFFFLQGIYQEEKKGRATWASWLAFSLAINTQLTFFIATAGWNLFRVLQNRRVELWQGLLIVPVAFLLWQVGLASAIRPWTPELFHGLFYHGVASSLFSWVMPGPKFLGWMGLFYAAIALGVLTGRARVAMAVSLLPFLYLFTYRYSGMAYPRHAGSLHLLWISLVLVQWTRISNLKRRIFTGLLVGSVVGGLLALRLEIKKVYSDAVYASEAVAKEAKKLSRRPVLLTLTHNGIYSNSTLNTETYFRAFTLSALLNSDMYLIEMSQTRRIGCPYYSGSCDKWMSFGPENKGSSVSQLCAQGLTPFLVRTEDLSTTPPIANASLIYQTTVDTITDEKFIVFQLPCE
jgi:hypothetical protein